MNDYLNQVYWGNTLFAWFTALGIVLVSIFAVKLFTHFILKRFSKWALKTNTTWDNFAVTTVRVSGLPVLYASVIYFTTISLALPKEVRNGFHVAYLIMITFFILRIISSAFRKAVHSYVRTKGDGAGKEQQASGLIVVVNVVIWAVGIVFLIDNLGYDVTTLVAGLGIGGIAIALASQAILGDLFSYFVIFFDRPFEIGDFIVVDDKSGTIEHIGIKTTRIRTLGGEQLICANTDLTNARLHNYKRLEQRRVLFTLGVTYQTTHDQLKQIPSLVCEIISAKEKVQFDRGHFSAFADSSLNFEFVYYILDSDYRIYMDKQQEIYLDIFAAFEQQGIEFAYPTQTLFIEGQGTLSSTVAA